MNPQIENKQENVDTNINICDVDVNKWLSIIESRADKSIEKREEFYKYTQFCENIFNISEEKKDDKNYVEKIEDNNKACINIFDQCLINS